MRRSLSQSPLFSKAPAPVRLLHHRASNALGWRANSDQPTLRASEEITTDRAYLESLRVELAGQGFKVQTTLAMGDPATELVRTAQTQNVDLIAMSTHGRSNAWALLRVPLGMSNDPELCTIGSGD